MVALSGLSRSHLSALLKKNGLSSKKPGLSVLPEWRPGSQNPRQACALAAGRSQAYPRCPFRKVVATPQWEWGLAPLSSQGPDGELHHLTRHYSEPLRPASATGSRRRQRAKYLWDRLERYV